MDLTSNQQLKNMLIDLHKGIHVALDAHIKAKNAAETELVLRQVDERLASLINNLKIVRN